MEDPGGPHHVEFSFIGNQILFSEASGFASSKTTKNLLGLNSQVESELHKKEDFFVQIEDFTNLTGFTLNARLTYIGHFQKRLGMSGLIFYGVSYLTSLSIKIAAKLYLVNYPVKVASSYEEAIKLSLELLEEDSELKEKIQPDTGHDDAPLQATPKKRLLDHKTIDDYRMDVLKYLGTLNLDVSEPGYGGVQFDKDHPFVSVFETIDVINHDLNQLTLQRQKDEEKKIELERKLADAQKMEALGTLAGGIAHDFNNILSGMMGYCQLAKMNIDNRQKTSEQIDQIQKGATRAADLVNQILIFSRNTEYKKNIQRLGPAVSEAMALLKSSIPVTIRIEEDVSSRHFVLADAAKIHQIVMNLCTNAYHAMFDTGGVLKLSLSDVEISDPNALDLPIAPGNYVKLVVSDTGHGMDAETMYRIFDPYFTTKEVGKGTGMGLSLVYAIVQEHGGYIKVDSKVKKGTWFTAYLPATDREVEDNSETEIEEMPGMGNERVMVVDDEISILESTEELLQDFGYQVESYADGEKALEAFNDDPFKYDLVITDMTMPGITGDKLAAHMLSVRKEMPIILCTGFNENMSEAKASDMGIKRFVQKPVVGKSITEIIREVLDS